MTTHCINVGCQHITSYSVSGDVMFSVEILSSLKVVKSHLKQSYDKLDLTLMEYEIFETSTKACFINFI